ncbi:heterokaryon incompatibility protein-domain-containing protein [Xylariomycetidae sp. FL2044]|nr:heterokaryon incompatibility protein-domain-containing protein [Xylariomycetidae sp. FL2044]
MSQNEVEQSAIGPISRSRNPIRTVYGNPACCRCHDLLKKMSGFLVDDFQLLHRKAVELTDGVRHGCWLCVRILGAASRSCGMETSSLFNALSSLSALAEFESQSDTCFESFTILFSYTLSIPGLGARCRGLFGIDYHELLPHHDSTFIPYMVAGHTSSRKTWDYIKSRLQNCQDHRSLCRQSSSCRRMPSRLIEEQTEGANHRFRVVSTIDENVQEPYITLSHRWGDSVLLKLTKGNMVEFGRRLPSEKMPQTFIDAAIAAQELGIRYLWIDSLCILQDSPDDWAKQSSIMDQVYQNGYCNLAATDAGKETQGLFYKRFPAQVMPHLVVFAGKKYIYYQEDDHPFKALDSAPLNRRGWVLQERLLARRNLSFTRDLVIYECAEELSSEVENILKRVPFLGVDIGGFRTIFDSETFTLAALNSVKALNGENAHEFWRKVVTQYSNCNLTRESDKLPALAGLAAFFHRTIQSVYLAGLWYDETLCKSLAWHRGWGPQRIRPPSYRAPSWSWASCEQQIFWPVTKETEWPLVKIINAYAEPVTQTNPFGQIQDARIHIVGWLFPIRALSSHPISNKWDRITHVDGISPYSDLISAIFQELLDAPLVAQCTVDSIVDPAPQECYFLPLCHGYDSITKHPVTQAIILVAVTPSRGVFQRIGHCRIHYYWPDKHESIVAEPKAQTFDPDQDSVLEYLLWRYGTPEVPSHEQLSDGRHRITLV